MSTIQLIDELREYFDDRADADVHPTLGGVTSNEEMRLLGTVDEVELALHNLRAALADLVFQCEEHPTIQTDRAKAVLDETK